MKRLALTSVVVSGVAWGMVPTPAHAAVHRCSSLYAPNYFALTTNGVLCTEGRAVQRRWYNSPIEVLDPCGRPGVYCTMRGIHLVFQCRVRRAPYSGGIGTVYCFRRGVLRVRWSFRGGGD